jgi:glycosyltransferase involved in cell wall biosynthesis
MLSPYRIEALPTRVDLDRFYAEPKPEARERLGLARDALMLVTVGRLCWIKGWDLLLRVVEVLKVQNPGIVLLFVGDGEDRKAITAEVKARGLTENIRITGFVSPETVRTFLSAGDVYVVGSYSEGWSVAMLEALACGKPIVSMRVSGSNDMIIDGLNGFVVDERNPDVYAAALRCALALPDAGQVSRNIAARYSVSGLRSELRKQWPALQDVTPIRLDASPAVRTENGRTA